MQIVGLYRDGKHYKTATLSSQKVMPKLTTEPTHPKRVSVTALKKVLLRPHLSPLKKKAAILASLPIELETSLPFAPSDCITIPLFQNETTTLITAKKSHLEKHISTYNSPHITSIPSALFRYCTYLVAEKEDLSIIYVGQEETFGIRRRGGFVSHYTHLPHGITNLKWDHYIQEIDQMLTYFDVKEVHFCGDIDQMEGLEEALIDTLKLTPFHPEINVKAHALPIGMALDVLAQDDLSVDFRKKQYTHPKIKHKLRASAFSNLLLSLAFSCFLYMLLGKYHQREVNNFQEDLAAFKAHYESTFPKIKFAEVEDLLPLLRTSKQSASNYKMPTPITEHLSTFPTNLNYTLCSADYLRSPDRYAFRLEFTSPTPEEAETFHELLLTKATDVEWRQGIHGYQVSFKMAQ